MKVRVTFKDPDVVQDAVRDAVVEWAKGLPGLTLDEREALIEVRAAKVRNTLEAWVEYGEYITVDFDTDVCTATVVKANR